MGQAQSDCLGFTAEGGDIGKWRPHTQTLAAFVQSLPEKQGIEKNLLAKKFIKSIIYSKELIQLNLFYSSAQKEKIGAESAGISGFDIQYGCSFRLNSNYIIPIILPNTIHQCKKKNL